MEKSEQTNIRETIDLLWRIITGLFAIAYISGYLIVTDHLNELGIRTSGVNIIKAKYIWIGFLYLLPFFLVTVVAAFRWLSPSEIFERSKFRFYSKRKMQNKYKTKYEHLVLGIIAILGSRMIFFDAQWREDTSWLLCATMVIFLLHQFAHRIELYQREKLDSTKSTLSGIETSSDNAFSAKRILSLKEEKKHLELCIDRSRELKDFLRWISLGPAIGIAYYIVATLWFPAWPYLPRMWIQKLSDWFSFFAFSSTVISLHMQISTAFHRDSISSENREKDSAAHKRARWVIRAVLLITLFLGSIHGFTHVIYPRIPVERGGGKYSGGAVADVCMSAFPGINGISTNQIYAQQVSLDNFCASGVTVKDVVLLEEDPDTLYVASVYDHGIQNGVGRSQATPSCGIQSWHAGTNSPRVTALNREALIGAREKDTVEHYCSTDTKAISNSSP